jgi:hypothetical protein
MGVGKEKREISVGGFCGSLLAAKAIKAHICEAIGACYCIQFTD